MSEFAGFPAGTQNTPVPNLFFASLLPQIQDLAELKVVLHIFWALYRKKEYPRFVTFAELAADKTLMSGLSQGEDDAEQALSRGLKQAVDRRLLLCQEMETDSHCHQLYFINTETDREAMERVRRGEVSLGALPAREPYSDQAPADIFRLYEDNIGVLTPLVADRMKEAEAQYPPSWIVEAIEEAVRNNARKWSYIEAILRRWASEGKESGEDRGHPEKAGSPQKYFRGKYGHLVKRNLP